ncbi:hypothetical protein DFS34DRAFT_159132 [Phlyctochytrium arcticum]|nr:hypothetical protein DFS34DRAFT_159132 [Phlyctochytrium arcticum]
MSHQGWNRNGPPGQGQGHNGQQPPQGNNQQTFQQQQQMLQNVLPFLGGAQANPLQSLQMNPLNMFANPIAGAATGLSGSAPAGVQSQAPSINSLQMMLQQLQQQQQQPSVIPKAQTPQTSSQLGQFNAQPPSQMGQFNPQPTPHSQANRFPPQQQNTLPTQVTPGQGALNMQNLAQLQQLQQLQQQQQQQQLARLLVALLPNALQGANLGLPNTQLPMANTQQSNLSAIGSTVGAPQQGQSNHSYRNSYEDRRDGRSRDDRDRRRDRDGRDDSRDRNSNRRDRSRSPERSRRRRKDYRSDSDSDDSYYSSRQDPRSNGRDNHRSPPRQHGSPLPPDTVALQTRHLWVGDLPADATEQELRQVFDRHGPISEIKVLPVKRGKASCFLVYTTKLGASKCMGSDNLVRGRPIVCRVNSRFLNVAEPDEHEYRMKPGTPKEVTQAQGFVHIRGLKYGITREDILNEFEKHCPVLEVRKKPNHDQAIVEFKTAGDALLAKNNVRARNLWGPRVALEVLDFAGKSYKSGGDLRGMPSAQVVERGSPAFTRQQHDATDGQNTRGGKRMLQESASLYLPMVPPALDRAELASAFEVFGPIQSLRIIPGKFTQHAMAFVNFQTVMSAKNAIEGLDGKLLFGMREPVRVEFAQSAGRNQLPPSNHAAMQNANIGNGHDAMAKINVSPESPVVVVGNFSQRLSGREIIENLRKVLNAKFPTRKEILLFKLSSLEDCFAIITPLSQWEADAVQRDLDNLEFFGSPLSAKVSKYGVATAESEIHDDEVSQEVSMQEVLRIVPIVKYHVTTATAATSKHRLAFCVQGATFDIDEDALKKKLAQYGDMAFCDVRTEDSVHSAYVAYFDSPLAVRAHQEMPSIDLLDSNGQTHTLETGLAEIRTSFIRVETENEIPQEEIARVFSRYGKITRQVMTRQGTKAPQTYLEYETVESAHRAVEGMSDEMIGGFGDELAVCFIDPRLDRTFYEQTSSGAHVDEDEDDGEVIMEGMVMPTKIALQTISSTESLEDMPNEETSAEIGGMAMDIETMEEKPAVKSEIIETAMDTDAPASEAQVLAIPDAVENTEKVNGDNQSGANETPLESVASNEPDPVPLPTSANDMTAYSPPPGVPSSRIPAPCYTGIISLKNREASLAFHLLSGSEQALALLPPASSGTAIKLTQRFKISPPTLQELERKLVPELTPQWAVGVAYAADGDSANEQHLGIMLDYLSSRDAGGMSVAFSTAMSLLPPGVEAEKLLARFVPDENLLASIKERSKWVLAVVIRT